jgi:RimJ/RimL family protein N-acetyltransferase
MGEVVWRVGVPELVTERLVIRSYRASDHPACAAMWSDPELVRHIGGRGFSPEEVWTRILRHVGHWAVLGFGYWVIEERATGRFAGEVGVADVRREIEPAWGDVLEAGWALAPWAQGRGLATEAVTAMLAWVDRERAKGAAGVAAGRRLVCMIEATNVASRRVAEKVGFRERGMGRYQGEALVIYERP